MAIDEFPNHPGHVPTCALLVVAHVKETIQDAPSASKALYSLMRYFLTSCCYKTENKSLEERLKVDFCEFTKDESDYFCKT